MKTRKFDPAEHLKSPEAQAELISEAFGTGDPRLSTLTNVLSALGFALEAKVLPNTQA